MTTEHDLTMGYGEPALRKAFGEICNKENWKLAVSAIIPAADLALYEAATIFFTGGGLELTGKVDGGKKLRVYGHGYYHYIGA